MSQISSERLVNIHRLSGGNKSLNFVSSDKTLFGLRTKEEDVPLSQASDRLDRGETVILEEEVTQKEFVNYSEQWIWQKSPTQKSGVITLRETRQTVIDDAAELEEYHAYVVDGEVKTPRQELAAKLQSFQDSDTWRLNDSQKTLWGKLKTGEQGISAFEAAGRILNQEPIVVTELNKPLMIDGLLHGDEEKVQSAFDYQFVKAETDLQVIGRNGRS